MGEGSLRPRAIAGVSTRARGSGELPAVYQSDDCERKRAPQRNRAHVWGAAGDGEAVCEVVSGKRGARILCAASATIRGGADGRSEGPGPGAVGGRQECAGGGEGVKHSGGHVAQGDWGGLSASPG